MNGTAICVLESPVEIEKNQKIYLWAVIGDNDDDMIVGDLSSFMKDKELFASFDKEFVFYAKFK